MPTPTRFSSGAAPSTPNARRSFNSPLKKRKYSRKTESEKYTELRNEASKTLKHVLNLKVRPEKVSFTAIAFKKRRCLYLWKANPIHSSALTEDELCTIERTICSERYPWSWSDSQRESLTALIKSSKVIPELINRGAKSAGDASNGDVPFSWDPQPSETESGESSEEEEELPANAVASSSKADRDRPSCEAEPPRKRMRARSLELGTFPSSLYYDARDEVIDLCSPNSESSFDLFPAPLVVASQTPNLSVQTPIPNEPATPSSGDPASAQVKKEDELAHKLPSPPPRPLTLNANGILELAPVRAASTETIINAQSSDAHVVAPVAASPTDVHPESMDMDDSDSETTKKEDEYMQAVINNVHQTAGGIAEFFQRTVEGYLGVVETTKRHRKVEKDLNRSKLEIESLRRTLQSCEERVRALESDSVALRVVKEKSMVLEEELAVLRRQFHLKESLLESQMKDRDALIADHVRAKVSFQEKLSAHEETTKSQTEMIDVLKAKVAESAKDICDKKASAEAASIKIKELKAKNASSLVMIQNLQAKDSAASGKISELEADNASMTALIAMLEANGAVASEKQKQLEIVADTARSQRDEACERLATMETAFKNLYSAVPLNMLGSNTS